MSIKYRVALALILVLIIITGTACQTVSEHHNNAKLYTAATDHITEEKITPLLIAEGIASAGEGAEMTIQILMTEGREITDTEPGPFQGTFRTGKFEVVAINSSGQELAQLPLNDVFGGEEMSFPQAKPFELLFDDYNDDGQPDFTIGQWGGSNGNFYCLLTLEPNGFGILERNIYSADHYPSIRYAKAGEKAFLNKYYDQLEGKYMDVVHRWADGAFVKDKPVESKEISSAGILP